MNEPVYVDDYCCSVDILPTLLNLFGFEYDSRLMVGTDVLSDSNHTAILSNQSFINDKVMFDSESNKTTYLVDKSTLPDNYVESMIKTIKNRISVSSLILNTDYYRFVWENSFPDALKTSGDNAQSSMVPATADQ